MNYVVPTAVQCHIHQSIAIDETTVQAIGVSTELKLVDRKAIVLPRPDYLLTC